MILYLLDRIFCCKRFCTKSESKLAHNDVSRETSHSQLDWGYGNDLMCNSTYKMSFPNGVKRTHYGGALKVNIGRCGGKETFDI